MSVVSFPLRNSTLKDFISFWRCSVRYLHESVDPPLSANDTVLPSLENRNPRNLEKLRIAYKPKGYHLEKPFRNFWHKLVISRTGRHISAKVIHNSGPAVISASTTEWCIRKYLYRTNDTSAYINVAKVLSQRCLESGITEMQTDFVSNVPKSEKLSSFLKVMEDNGIILVEPERFEGYKPWDMHRPEKPWEVIED